MMKHLEDVSDVELESLMSEAWRTAVNDGSKPLPVSVRANTLAPRIPICPPSLFKKK
jgi:hypothetical protein